MEDQLISYNTAVLAKEKGFNIPTLHNYGKKEELGLSISLAIDLEMAKDDLFIDWNKYVGTYRQISAPTQSLLQRWLREIHNIIMYIESPYHQSNKWRYCIELETIDKFINSDYYLSYEQALEAGLLKALSLIK